MALSFIQSNNASNTGTTSTCAYTSNNAAGNLLVVVMGIGGALNPPTSVTGTGSGNLFVPFFSIFNATNSAGLYCYSCLGAAGGANTVTVTMATSTFIEIVVWEFHSTAGSWRSDCYSTNANTTNTTTPTSGSTPTLSNSSEVLIGYCFTGGTVSGGSGGGWVGSVTGNGNWPEYEIVSANTPQAATFTTTSATSVSVIGSWYATSQLGILYNGFGISQVIGTGTGNSNPY